MLLQLAITDVVAGLDDDPSLQVYFETALAISMGGILCRHF